MTATPAARATHAAAPALRADHARPKSILFTAFEPSGDDHAAVVIAALRHRYPHIAIYAWGGPKMAAAGATIIEETGHDAVMGIPGLAKIREHLQINARIDKWLDANPIDLHVPVDSPAANFPICKLTKPRGIKVVHLVAPQMWAWGEWRVRKLRRLSDLVLCLLPFEEKWFKERGVPARFIGHPLFDIPLDMPALDQAAADLPKGPIRLALMPGSRPKEISKNFPQLLASFRDLSKDHPDLVGTIAATTPAVADRLRAMANETGGWPINLAMLSGQTDTVIRWCSAALVVSGTVTLQIAKQSRPMVVFYKSNPLVYMLLGRWVLTTEFFTLPNLIAGREIVPELIPHFAGYEPVLAAARTLLSSPDKAARQIDDLNNVTAQFQGHRAGPEAAAAICEALGIPA